MFTRSISSAVAQPMPKASAFSWITGNSASRFFSESFFESLSPGMSQSGGRITAAAHTGPAKGPRPASSMPHTAEKPCSPARFS